MRGIIAPHLMKRGRGSATTSGPRMALPRIATTDYEKAEKVDATRLSANIAKGGI